MAPGDPPPPRRSRGIWSRVAVAAVAAALGALLTSVGLGLTRHDQGSSVTRPVPTQPSPSSAANSGGGAAPESASTSQLDVGVVDINTELAYENARAAGTGMIISSSGEILTNAHVISGATTITVTVVTTGRSYLATVLGSDATEDIALLRLNGAPKLDTVRLGDSSTVAVGDTVTAVGNAGGVGGIPSVSPGTVTGVDQSITVGDGNGGDSGQLSGLIETDASLEPGDSGGPMYNTAGEVIGINTAADSGPGFSEGSNESYAIAIDTAETIAEKIASGQASSTIQIGVRGFLGVQVQNGSFGGGPGGASTIPGVVVSGVLDGTPAQGAGLQVGDVITGIDGQTVESNDSLTARLHGHHPGDKVRVTWTDVSGTSRSATVTLATGPA